MLEFTEFRRKLNCMSLRYKKNLCDIFLDPNGWGMIRFWDWGPKTILGVICIMMLNFPEIIPRNVYGFGSRDNIGELCDDFL